MTQPAPREDRRQFIRIPSIIPVEFQLLSSSGESLHPEILTGFTYDLSEGGMCLRVPNLPAVLQSHLSADPLSLRISVDISMPNRAIRVPGKLAWHHTEVRGDKTTRLLGVQFLDIASDDAAAVAGFARREAARPKRLRRIIAGLVAGLLVAAGLFAWSQSEREQAERALRQSAQQYSITAEELERLWIELRWLSTEVGDMATSLRGTGKDAPPAVAVRAAPRGRIAPQLQLKNPAVEDLSVGIAELRTLVDALKVGQERGEPGAHKGP